MTFSVRRIVAAILLPFALAACGAEKIVAPAVDVQRAIYVHDGPPKLTLFTVINKRNGSGAHTALMVNGSQRALFDPAGSFNHPALAERNDVQFGMTPNIVTFYIDYHARETYDVIVQELNVSPEVAEQALRDIQANGAASKAHCSIATSRILRGLPGFGSFPTSYFPKQTSEAFAALPGATRRVVTDDDADDNHGVLLVPVAR